MEFREFIPLNLLQKCHGLGQLLDSAVRIVCFLDVVDNLEAPDDGKEDKFELQTEPDAEKKLNDKFGDGDEDGGSSDDFI